ncbi:MAG: hypothetical protein FWC11_06360, partial [Firmicutes bacterium]|nr:hypothetical protein [Bacillota bacterium]
MKRKIFLTILLIAFAIFATIAFAACDRNGDYPLYDETYQLSVPQNFTINTQTGIATWGEVENARTFTIRSGDFTAISDTNSFYMGDLRLTPGTHVVSVRADGRIENLVRYIESGFSDEATFVKAEPAGTRIYNQVQLVALLNNSSGTFVLGNDIVLTYQIPPIENFTGTLDGANRSIIGLTFTGNHQHAGLFGVVRNGKTVRNLNLDNFNFNIDATSQVFAGALISRIELDYARDISINIENVFVRGLNINATSSTSDAYAGGLIGSVWTGLFTNHAKP